MKYLLIILLPLTLYASEPTNECGQTYDQWVNDSTSHCFSSMKDDNCLVYESGFNMATHRPILTCVEHSFKNNQNEGYYQRIDGVKYYK
jgi:hypothetical protein